jgi:phage protein D
VLEFIHPGKAATSGVRRPRGAVLVNDVLVPWESWHVESNATFNADTFSVQLVATRLPRGSRAGDLTDGRSLRVEIRAGFPADPDSYTLDELETIIVGQVDEPVFDPVAGTLELSGRDFTALLIDRKTGEKFANMTASQIADVLAARVGLNPVTTPTTRKAGALYDADHARVTQTMSEWDLLCWLAHEEDYRVYVRGLDLVFEPRPAEDGSDSVPYVLRWTPPNDDHESHEFDGTSLRLTRNLTTAKDVTVTVKSWNAKSKAAVVATYPQGKHKSAAPGTSGAGQPEGYVRNIPGLTHEQALQRAQAIHREITAHEMRMEVSLPADPLVDAMGTLMLTGTGTAFDQLYFPESISREMSLQSGYLMTVHAKNSSPENQPTL